MPAPLRFVTMPVVGLLLVGLGFGLGISQGPAVASEPAVGIDEMAVVDDCQRHMEAMEAMGAMAPMMEDMDDMMQPMGAMGRMMDAGPPPGSRPGSAGLVRRKPLDDAQLGPLQLLNDEASALHHVGGLAQLSTTTPSYYAT